MVYTNYLYITPEQTVEALKNVFGEDNVSSLSEINPTVDNDGNLLKTHALFTFQGKEIKLMMSNQMGYVGSLPKSTEIEAYANTFNHTKSPEANGESITITPEVLLGDLKTIYGEQNFVGPTNVESTNQKVTFEIEFFKQPLNVIFDIATGNVCSIPYNMNLVYFANECNKNHGYRGDKLVSRLPINFAKPIEEMSKIVQDKSIKVPVQQIIDGLISKFGPGNVELQTPIKKNDNGLSQFMLLYFGAQISVSLESVNGVIFGGNENLEKQIYLVQSEILANQKSTSSSSSTTSPDSNKIKITPKQLVDNLNGKYGAGNVSEPENVVDNGHGQVTFKINYFGSDLNVTFNNGSVETDPWTNNNLIRHALEENNKI